MITNNPAIHQEGYLSLSGKIIHHYWNKPTNEIIALIKEEQAMSLIKVLDQQVVDSHPVDFSVLRRFGNPSHLISDQDGEHIVFFLHDEIWVYSWESKELVAQLKAAALGRRIKFDQGDFLDKEQIWVQAKLENHIYLLVWEWASGAYEWVSLRTNIQCEEEEEKEEMECQDLAMHPSRQFFFGLADYDHGGYHNKVFFLWPPKERQIPFIHPQALGQNTETSIDHHFNDAGDKIAGIAVQIGPAYSSVAYELKVYAIEDLSHPLQTYTIDGQKDGLFSSQFLANDQYMAIEGSGAFRIVDMEKGKRVFQSELMDKGIQFGPGKLSFCTRKDNELFFYRVNQHLVVDFPTEPQKFAQDFLEQYAGMEDISIVHPINCYSQLELVPYVNIYFEFYSATFDLRNKVRVRGDSLPEEMMQALDDWLAQHQASYLAQWQEKIGQREKYEVNTNAGPIEFYPMLEQERKNKGPAIYIVYESTVATIYFLHRLQFPNAIPEEVRTIAKAWLFANYDLITAPWKDYHYYTKFKEQAFLGMPKNPELAKPNNWLDHLKRWWTSS
ncbi:MAG: hypothetical protein AAFP19_26175 [Bacteroidota bacterium]